MANKIESFSSKIEIINYFDSLINRVDIDIEKCLENYNEEQILGLLTCFGNRYISYVKYYVEFLGPSESSDEHMTYPTVDEWSESTKVVDYLNGIRKKTIEELRKAQEKALEYYKQNSSHFKSQEIGKIDELRRELFKEQFYFQVLHKPENSKYAQPWIFNLHTFVTDFYMTPSDINFLESLINSSQNEIYEEVDEEKIKFFARFDERAVLICLLQKCFFENLETQKFPSHVISVRKEDLMNIREIDYMYGVFGVNLTADSINLCNLEELSLNVLKDKRRNRRNQPSLEIKIEGLSSLKCLHVKCQSIEQIKLGYLCKLTSLALKLSKPIDSNIQSNIFGYLPNIEKLALGGNFSNFNLDSLVSLKSLSLFGLLMDGFNFDIFKNISNRFEKISISCPNLDDKHLAKLFYGHNFPHLLHFEMTQSRITKMEKKLFQGFPMLQKLLILNNDDLRIIDHDAFSNLMQLEKLCLSFNCIESIDKSLFSHLISLKSLDLSDNRLKSIEENCFSSLHNLEYLDLSHNQLAPLDPKSFAGLNNLKNLIIR